MNSGILAVICWIILTVGGIVYFRKNMPQSSWRKKSFFWAEGMRAYFFVVAALAAGIVIIGGLVMKAFQ